MWSEVCITPAILEDFQFGVGSCGKRDGWMAGDYEGDV